MLVTCILLSTQYHTSDLEAGEPETTSIVPASKNKGGMLVIAGGGDLPPSVIGKFVQGAGGRDDANLGIMPSASVYASDPTKGPEFYLEGLGKLEKDPKIIHAGTSEEVTDDFAEQFKHITGLWITGGKQERLRTIYGQNEILRREISELLRRGGVLGTTSAGTAMVGSIAIIKDDPELLIEDGFGIINGVSEQHFNTRPWRVDRLFETMRRRSQDIGFAIDEGTALVIEDPSDDPRKCGSMYVVGIGQVRFFISSAIEGGKPTCFSFKSGPLINLPKVNDMSKTMTP